jgi:hypothetical protein
LVRLLAVLAKTSFAYAEGSQRVNAALTAFRSALLARTRETGRPFTLENRSDALHTATGRVPDGNLGGWLRQLLQKALIGAIRLSGELENAALLGFLAQLRAIASAKPRKDASFAGTWPGRFEGLELVELRFAGGFHALDFGSDAGNESLRASSGDQAAELQAALRALDLPESQLARLGALDSACAGPHRRPPARHA